MNSKYERRANYYYKTKETEVTVEINLDGSGKTQVETGINFFNHLLENMAIFALFDLKLNSTDKKEIDSHHLIEDTGIAMGEAMKLAIGDRKSIERLGFCYIPLDETLVRISVDISGRAFLSFESPLEIKFETIDFLRALTTHSFITVHVDIIRGKNEHHINEAIFKGIGYSLRMALSINKKIKGVLSSK